MNGKVFGVAAGLLIAALLLFATVQTFRLQSVGAALETERLGRASDRDAYRRAQAETMANALSDKLKKDAENAHKAEQADQRYADLSQQYRAAVLRYQAAQREAGSADLSIPAESPESGDGPGGGAIVPLGSILIPENDAFICATNTARLTAVHEWAVSLTQSATQ